MCEKHFKEKLIEKCKYCHYCKIYMNCNDICIFMRQLLVSSVVQYEVMNCHVYVHNNNVVHISLKMLLVKDAPGSYTDVESSPKILQNRNKT